jgi:hypothetical protein
MAALCREGYKTAKIKGIDGGATLFYPLRDKASM